VYTPRQIAKGLQWSVTSPNLVLREMNRLYHRRLYNRTYNPAGVGVMDEDWDTLVLLDACRYDMFRDQHSLPGTLKRRRSRGSHTSEFILGNFHGREFLDTVYVTASPILYRGLGRKYRTRFHDVINVWAENGWDEESRTVLPETTTKFALEAAERYPNKRLVVHYIQPHYPFIDSDVVGNAATVPDPDVLETDVWGQLMTGKIDIPRERVWAAYCSNLDRALPHIKDLLERISGKTVVTADHGNMIGERASPVPVREWGHPPGVYTCELVDVPWLEYESGPRRTVRAEEPDADEDQDVETDVVVERLQDLGYAG
jgi:hypothetical protein